MTICPPVILEVGSETGIVTTSRRVGLVRLTVVRTLSVKTPFPSGRIALYRCLEMGQNQGASAWCLTYSGIASLVKTLCDSRD